MAFKRRLACLLAFAVLSLTAACSGSVPVSERERTSLAADTYVTDADHDSALAKDAEPARNPKLAGVLTRVAVVAENSGDYQTAARLYRRAHTLDPSRSDIPLSLGRALLATHDYAGAVEAFRVVLASDSGNEEAQRGLGVSLFTLGRYDEAVSALRASSRHGDDRVLRDLAISYDISGNPKEAQKVYRRAMERNPNDPTLRAHLALSHALNGEPDMVAPLLDPVAGNPNLTPHDRRVMAAAYDLAGDTHKARQLLRQDYDAKDTDRAFADFQNARALVRSNPGLAYALVFDPERSGDDARTELAQLGRTPDSAKVATNSDSGWGFRPAATVLPEQPQDSASAPPLDFGYAGQLQEPERLADFSPSPVQVADATGRGGYTGRHGRGYHVQLGAYRTEPRAEKGWHQLKRKAPEELGNVGHIVVADQRNDGRPALYQLRTTAYSDRREASELCRQLKTKSVDCFVIASRGAPVATRDLVAGIPDDGTSYTRGTSTTSPRRHRQVADASPAGRVADGASEDHQYQVQLAAYRSLQRAERGWQILNRTAPNVLGNLTPIVVTPEQLPEANPLFRLRTREFAEKPPAEAVCSDLRTQNLDCLVVATRLRTVGSNIVAEASRPAETTSAPKKVRKAQKKGAKASRENVANITPSDTASPVATPDSAPTAAATAPVDTAAAIPAPEPSKPEQSEQRVASTEPDPSPEPSSVADDASRRDLDRTGYAVQLAAYKNERLATNAWKQFQKKAPDLLGKLRPVIAAPDGSAGGNLYRLRAATFEERAVADAMCYELKARKLDCLVVQSRLAGHDLARVDDGKDGAAAQVETIEAPRP